MSIFLLGEKIYICNMKIYIINGIDAFDEDFVEKCLCFFPQWRRDKALRYRFLRGRVQCVLTYLLLIHALREEGVFYEMPEFYYGEHDKPYMKNYPEWHFNFSHSKNTVCCVLSRNEVGVDIEDVGLYKENLAVYVSNDEELNLLHESNNKADDFCRLWTQKEAVFKKIGSGITANVKNILIDESSIVESYKIDNSWISIAYDK